MKLAPLTLKNAKAATFARLVKTKRFVHVLRVYTICDVAFVEIQYGTGDRMKTTVALSQLTEM
jgi:hypothetical protein